MTGPDFSAAMWRKSSYSNGTGNCVEVAHSSLLVGVRDSKNPSGPILTFPAASLATTTRKLIAGFALSAARKDAPAFGQRIKAAVEAS
jgi:hypothetical protein